MKYGELNLGQIEAIVNRLGGMEGAMKFLRDELVVSEPERKWREQDGVIYLPPLTSDGTTGEEWIDRLESQGFRVNDSAKSVLRSRSFKPTSGVTYEIAILKGEIFSDSERITKNIRDDAKNRKLTVPNPEIACLIREKFSDKKLKEMDLYWIAVMHKPINDSDDSPRLLGTDCDNDGCPGLDTASEKPNFRWHQSRGFAFVASQKKN